MIRGKEWFADVERLAEMSNAERPKTTLLLKERWRMSRNEEGGTEL